MDAILIRLPETIIISILALQPRTIRRSGLRKSQPRGRGWGNTPPNYVIDKGSEGIDGKLFDGARNKFTNFPTVTDHITSLWNLQWNDLLALRSQDDLDNRSFFYLLHLLIGLGPAKNDKIADYVARLTRTKTPTEAYPEEKFINQLTYLALLYLGDAQEPESTYCLNNAARVQLFTELQDVVISTKSGSNAIQQSLARHLRIAGTLSDYPLFDPESNLPLSERKAMTRRALLRTFKTVPLEVPNSPWNGQSEAPETLSDEARAAHNDLLSNIIYP